MRRAARALAMLAFVTSVVRQPSAAPVSFTDRAVVVGADPWRLPGTLSVPRSSTPVPAVVVVHGSGPGDRDGTVAAVKPYRDLAIGLASFGVAVLRYDKRTLVHGARMASMNLTVKEETIDDAVAAAALLRSTPGIDSKRVFILGHSLGAMLIPRIANADRMAAGFILMAAPARPFEDLYLEQVRFLAAADGAVSDAEAVQIDAIRRAVDKIKDPSLTASTPATELLGAPASYWLDLRGYDPVTAAREIRVPMLVLQGRRDSQVTLTDFERWRAAFSTAAHVRLKLYPGLNHAFIAGTGPSLPAEYGQPGHVAHTVVRDIATWIRTR